MSQNIDLIVNITLCLSIALLFGVITQKLKMSPIVGYIIAGIIVGPFSPGFVANMNIASQLAQIGVVLLMFGVGLQFHLKDLMAVKNIAIFGAIMQIFVTTIIGAFFLHFLGYSLQTGLIYGISISVASTVVLIRVLIDNHSLYTTIGYTAIGWLVIEDLFTILVLVLCPAFFSVNTNSSILYTIISTILKLGCLVIFTLLIGQKIIPKILGYIAKTGTRDLFTLAVLVLALGIATAASEFFGASMALGAFLSGIVIGQSNFSARATSEALPMKDSFAVLFFVSVGMLFDPSTSFSNLKLSIITLFIVIFIKPIVAIFTVLFMKQSLKKALCVGIALAQIGEFSFILASLGMQFGIINNNIYNAIIATAIISITLNPIIYKLVTKTIKILRHFRIYKKKNINIKKLPLEQNENCTILAGYGPAGEKITPILLNAGSSVVIIDMNIETIQKIQLQKHNGLYSIYADASKPEILRYAGIECAQIIIISTPLNQSKAIIEVARSINPKIKIIITTNWSKDTKLFKQNGADIVFSAQQELANTLSCFVLKEFATTSSYTNTELIEWECKRFYSEND